MNGSMRNILEELPKSSLYALNDDQSGRLKETLILLIQLAESYKSLVEDSPVVVNGEPSGESEAKWLGRAEAVMIHSENVLSGKARVPSAGDPEPRNNVVSITSKLRKGIESKKYHSEVTLLAQGKRVINYRADK